MPVRLHHIVVDTHDLPRLARFWTQALGWKILSEREQFLRHRIADERVLRLIGKWLAAGVIEDGQWTESEKGSPQGALCAAAHNAPYEQCWVMRSSGLPGLVGAGSASERCA